MRRWIKTICFCCILLLLAACGKSREQQIAEQLELGQKYLAEMNYEEAIVAFQKVIELDDRNIEAYLGLGQTYESQAESVMAENREEALRYYGQAAEAYEKVLELAPGSRVSMERLVIIYKELGDLDKLRELVEQYEESDSGEASIEQIEIWRSCIDIIGQISDACDIGDIDRVFLLMQSEEYRRLQEAAMELGSPVFDMGSGKGLGLYPVVTEEYGDCMIYYGDYQNGIRQGTGYWMGYYNGNNYRAYGQWADDIPEGDQEVREWSGNLNETVRTRVIIGPVTRGLWNGSILWRFERKDGGAETYPVSFAMGKWVILRESEETDQVRYIVSEHTLEGGDGSGTMSAKSPDETEGIEGFR